jgi:zinc transport system permease protein
MNLLTQDFRKIIWGSIGIGFVGCIAGLFLSYYLNVPSGAFIIVVFIVLFLLTKTIKKAVRR